MITNIHGDHVWSVDGHTVDTRNSDIHAYPCNVRDAVLAHRDAETAEERDLADLLIWSIEEHPPWDGGCSACQTTGICDFQGQMRRMAIHFLIERTTLMIARYRAGTPVRHAA